MKIASHHQWKENEYQPRHDWPGDTLVQWGGRGIVLGRNPRSTAFFEAFPDEKVSTAGGFIRGEGASIEITSIRQWFHEIDAEAVHDNEQDSSAEK